ncbi:hypothetical protein EQO05_07390 [Methanosarcina sp. MSH10X1]|uniref:hypothetical protein n=1 Tax=Methanosarcina sp. MSH10X1 TaxID=2507075 RepID=UPI000FFC0899|nr:hypothetical protein [Methanosarcina sp. MSH10X1]RXA19958.1 hypothetical protein EQO05_07390 [Methanosarcina sp. MSH10X1]
MMNKKSARLKKTLAVLLGLCFVLSVTVESASAADNGKGYDDGYGKGYDGGKKQGHKDCIKYGMREVLSKIPFPSINHSWTKTYKDSYNRGYQRGYLDGYNKNRYLCLK